MEYFKIGDWVTFDFYGINGKGVVTKVNPRHDDMVLVKMVGNCSGMGHNYCGKYDTDDYYWFSASKLAKSDNRMYSGHKHKYTSYIIPATTTLTYMANEPNIDWTREAYILDVLSESYTIGSSGRYRW